MSHTLFQHCILYLIVVSCYCVCVDSCFLATILNPYKQSHNPLRLRACHRHIWAAGLDIDVDLCPCCLI